MTFERYMQPVLPAPIPPPNPLGASQTRSFVAEAGAKLAEKHGGKKLAKLLRSEDGRNSMTVDVVLDLVARDYPEIRQQILEAGGTEGDVEDEVAKLTLFLILEPKE